ncbi:MAG: RNA polymerase factor sigma-54 [Bacteroidaceae bacterium]|nr:RNA polymerase factor sigma-54 [Bacteroidaceae bacterium]
MSQGSHQIQTQAQQLLQTLSPHQILVVKLLELPTMELEDRVRAEILDNPALEEGKEPSDPESTDDFEPTFNEASPYDNEDLSLGDYRTEDDIPDYKLQEHNRNKGEVAEEIPFSDSVSFYEMLLEQLSMQHLTEEEETIAEYLIGTLDDDGWLRKDFSFLIDELAIYRGIYTNEENLERILSIIQSFDPAGIGARSLQECLLLQLKRKPDTPIKKVETEIIERYCDDFTRKNKEKIMQRLDISEEVYDEAISELTKLNPRPGSSLGDIVGKNYQQIIPDFLVETEEDGSIILTLNNGNIPELRLSREFNEMLEEHTINRENQSKDSRDAFLFLKQKVDAAQGFINAIKQRHQTLLTTMQAIIDLQRPFFLEGDETLLKPMILKDIAERAKLDVSTVSRVSNSKYVQTNYGIFPLRFFFSDGFTTEEGEELSIREIKQLLRDSVDHENKENPYNDDELSDILREKGYPLARRTIAKYRQQLNIPTARLRRI